MKTLLGEITKCPRCRTPFSEGEEQRCRAGECKWPWPTKETMEFIDKIQREEAEKTSNVVSGASQDNK